MVDNEESFVRKVKGLDPSKRKAPMRPYKVNWWRIYQNAGEEGVREHFRREYVISASSLPVRLQHGDIVEDAEFAEFKRSGRRSGPAS
jgi:hypothetical protein